MCFHHGTTSAWRKLVSSPRMSQCISIRKTFSFLILQHSISIMFCGCFLDELVCSYHLQFFVQASEAWTGCCPVLIPLQLFLCPGLSGMNWTLFCPRWCCFKAFCEIPTPSQVSSLLRVNAVKQEIINMNFYSCRHIKLSPVSNYDQFYCDKA